jgi:hypothetical protein
MNTEPDAFQQQHIDPAKVQCPRCGAYNPKQNISYENPQTGKRRSGKEPDGCILYIVGFFVVFLALMAVWGIITLVYVSQGWDTRPGVSDYAGLGYLFVFLGPPICFIGTVFVPLYRTWRRNRLSKTHITVRHFVCRQCKNEWTVTQEPPAKKLS